jgi:hypothetical protein
MANSEIFIAAFVGITVFALVVYLCRHAKALGRRDGQIELVRLSERVTALNSELTAARSESNAKNSKFETLQRELDTTRADRARFEERATRAASLERAG